MNELSRHNSFFFRQIFSFEAELWHNDTLTWYKRRISYFWAQWTELLGWDTDTGYAWSFISPGEHISLFHMSDSEELRGPRRLRGRGSAVGMLKAMLKKVTLFFAKKGEYDGY